MIRGRGEAMLTAPRRAPNRDLNARGRRDTVDRMSSLDLALQRALSVRLNLQISLSQLAIVEVAIS